MAKSTLNPTKKRMGRPPVDSEQVNIRLARDLLDPLDVLATELESSRPAAIRFALRSFLEADGRREMPERLGQNFQVHLERAEVEALRSAFGEKFEDQREGIEGLVRDWLHNQNKSPSE